MIELVIFDADGVVIDSEKIWDKCQEEFLKRRGFTYDRDRFKHQLTGRSPVEGIQILQEAYGFSGNTKELAQERITLVMEDFRTNLEYVKGFLEFYRTISTGTFKTCVATALDNTLLEIADKRLKISTLFHGNVFSIADVGYVSKPNPDLFLYAARRLDTDPKSCLVIEDSPAGIEAARRAGMKCIALTTTYTRDRLVQADIVVDAFSQIELREL